MEKILLDVLIGLCYLFQRWGFYLIFFLHSLLGGQVEAAIVSDTAVRSMKSNSTQLQVLCLLVGWFSSDSMDKSPKDGGAVAVQARGSGGRPASIHCSINGAELLFLDVLWIEHLLSFGIPILLSDFIFKVPYMPMQCFITCFYTSFPLYMTFGIQPIMADFHIMEEMWRAHVTTGSVLVVVINLLL